MKEKILSEKSIEKSLREVLKTIANKYIADFKDWGATPNYNMIVSILLYPQEPRVFFIYSSIVEKMVSIYSDENKDFCIRSICGTWDLMIINANTNEIISIIPLDDVKPYISFKNLLKAVKETFTVLGYKIL